MGSWKDHDTEGVRPLESALGELSEALEGEWDRPFDLKAYAELRAKGVGGHEQMAFNKQQRSGNWAESDIAKEMRAESARMSDSLGRKGIQQILMIGLTARDVANLHALAEGSRLRNYGALVRDVISKAAKGG